MPSPAVLITGAATGIGEACAARMAERGWRVFAGVLDDAQREDVARRYAGRATPVVFDVTSAPQIDAAVRQVAAAVGDLGLAGLVNNAGIGVSGPLECVPIERFRKQLEVNLVAPVAVAQAFLPLLRQARGRIVNIASLAGRLTTPLLGPYCASKHGLEAVSDALRMELRPWGMNVICIEPGVIRTPILETSPAESAALFATFSPADRQRYAPLAEANRRVLEKFLRVAQPPEVVARAVERALTARRPRTRYVVGGAWRRLLWLSRLPDRARDWLLTRL